MSQISQIWNLLLYQPLVNALVFFYGVLGQNLGLAIIALTLAIRAVLLPLTLPSMRAATKMRELAPELGRLKKRYGSDRQRLAQEQMRLYRERGANPAAGCLPQIIQLIVLIALFQAFNQVLQPNGDIISKLNQVLYSGLQIAPDSQISNQFTYLDLTRPDTFRLPADLIGGLSLPPLPGLFLVGAAAIQFLTSKMMAPAASQAQKVAQKTEGASDDLATAMQSQMLYLFPLMTLVIGYTFPSGLVLYWLVFSATMLLQQLYLGKTATG